MIAAPISPTTGKVYRSKVPVVKMEDGGDSGDGPGRLTGYPSVN